jgi:hypothetical protein
MSETIEMVAPKTGFLPKTKENRVVIRRKIGK